MAKENMEYEASFFQSEEKEENLGSSEILMYKCRNKRGRKITQIRSRSEEESGSNNYDKRKSRKPSIFKVSVLYLLRKIMEK